MKKIIVFAIIMFHNLALADICQVAVTDQYTQEQYNLDLFPLFTGVAESKERACNIALNDCNNILFSLQDQGQFNTAYCKILK